MALEAELVSHRFLRKIRYVHAVHNESLELPRAVSTGLPRSLISDGDKTALAEVVFLFPRERIFFSRWPEEQNGSSRSSNCTSPLF